MAIVLKFNGGFKDGTELRSDSDDPDEAQQALAYYAMAENGAVGKRFRAISDAGFSELEDALIVDGDGVRLTRPPSTSMNHIYVVVAHDETGDDTTVRYEYQGQLDG